MLIMLMIFGAAFCYGAYLENGGIENEPVQIRQNFIEKDADLSVHYIDVGQGDCSLIVYKDETVLIDAGEAEYGSTVADYISALGIEQLDYVVATHPHSDHIGGLAEIIDTFEIGKVIAPKVSDEMTPTSVVYEDFLTSLKAKGLRLTAAKSGNVYSLADETVENDNTSFEILGPVRDDYDDLNNWSVVLKLTHGGTSFLFTGDAEKSAENDILDSGADLSADVLKAGHHGSSTSTGKKFLTAVDPEIAVIQCGIDNSYGHPHAEILDLFDENGVKYYRTDGCGSVVVYSDGNAVRALCEKGEK